MIGIEHCVWLAMFTVKDIHSRCWKIAAQGRLLQFYHQDRGGFDGKILCLFWSMLATATHETNSLLLTLKLIMTWLWCSCWILYLFEKEESGRVRWRKAKVKMYFGMFYARSKVEPYAKSELFKNCCALSGFSSR